MTNPDPVCELNDVGTVVKAFVAATAMAKNAMMVWYVFMVVLYKDNGWLMRCWNRIFSLCDLARPEF
jgi:hypothetical protein